MRPKTDEIDAEDIPKDLCGKDMPEDEGKPMMK